MQDRSIIQKPFRWIALIIVLIGCGKSEYQPPKDSIPTIPPGKTNKMSELSAPQK